MIQRPTSVFHETFHAYPEGYLRSRVILSKKKEDNCVDFAFKARNWRPQFRESIRAHFPPFARYRVTLCTATYQSHRNFPECVLYEISVALKLDYIDKRICYM